MLSQTDIMQQLVKRHATAQVARGTTDDGLHLAGMPSLAQPEKPVIRRVLTKPVQSRPQALKSTKLRYRPHIMAIKFPIRKNLLLTIAGFILVSLLLLWLALPGIIQHQAEAFIEQKSGHHLRMDKPDFNPLTLTLHLKSLKLTEPDGQPLLAFDELTVNLSTASLFRHALVFDNITLKGLEASTVLKPKGEMNWSALITALKSPEKTPDTGLPRFDIHRLTLSATKLDFSDMRVSPAYNTHIEPADLTLTEISSLPGDHGQYGLTAATTDGARLSWHGTVSLSPLSTEGDIGLENVKLEKLAGYFKDLPVSLSQGTAGFSGDYKVSMNQGRLDVSLNKISASLKHLALKPFKNGDAQFKSDEILAKGGSYDLQKNHFALASLSAEGNSLGLGTGPKMIALGKFAIDGIHINLATRNAKVEKVILKGGQIRASRNAKGQIDIAQLFNTPLSPAARESAKPAESAKSGKPATPWHYHIAAVSVSELSAQFKDETVSPAAAFELDEIALGVEKISNDLNLPLPLKASFKSRDGGNFSAEGSITPGLPAAEIQIKLADLNLAPAQPYLASVARLKLAGGKISTAGTASYKDGKPQYNGSFTVNDLLLNEADTGSLFLAWKSLDSSSFTVNQNLLDIDEVTLNGLDTKLIINKDKSVSLKRIMLPQSNAPKSAASTSPAAGNPTPFVVNIDRLRFRRGEMDFADYSLALPFGTRILNLRGNITGLSTQPGAIGQLALDGQVDEYGVARAAGKLNLTDPADFMDLKVVFRNIEMSRLTPYSATFAGRKIDSGKLSLDLQYKLLQRKLEGNNQITMDQLTLGDRVASPEAKDLPLDLAISILQDTDGRIELGLPMAGSLDDPQFSFNGLVWKAISNILSKIATAPFRALGALFGGGDKFESIAFESGRSRLAPPEREKLARLAEALTKRPTLSITVHGVYADSDRVALQERQMRRTIAEATHQHLDAGEDPGPVSTHNPKVQDALESLFSDALGRGELDALKDGYRKANPGQMVESRTGKAMSKLTGLFRDKRTLSEQEIANLKGVDFYAVLFSKLSATVAIDEKLLQTLAESRAAFTVATLKEAGAPVDRVSTGPAEKIKPEGQDVPVKLVLGTGK